ncbi:MAG TPA: nuclear transport factor 2 family protein [Paraburkholderia sp.]
MPSNELDANKQTALRFLALAFEMKMQDASLLLTDDATWWVIGDPERVKVAGHKDAARTRRMMSNMHRVLPHGMEHRVLGLTAEGDRVAVELEAEGEWHDGRLYRNRYHFLIRIRDKKVSSIREYMDPMQIPV